MEITIKEDDLKVKVKNDCIATWPEAVELFINALKAHGFYPKNFSYYDGDVNIESDEEIDDDIID